MQTTSESGAYWNAGGPKVYSEADIESAISAGAMTTDSAAALRRHVVGTPAVPVADEEYFRLVGGLNDIFVVVACSLLLTAMGALVAEINISLGGLAVAAASWGLAEYFVRRKRLALSAIVLLLSFLAGLAWGVGIWAGIAVKLVWNVDAVDAVFPAAILFVAVCVPVGAGAWLHWKRFHVPITVAAGTLAILGFTLAFLVVAFPALEENVAPVCFGFGLVVLALAMAWDSRDTLRQTRKSDVAFWLHLLSAPLLVHPVFYYMHVFDGGTTALQAAIIVALYVLIALVSLSIDRRALMVSSLAYVLFAFSALFEKFGAVSLDFAVSALLVGASLLLLSAFWQTARGRVVALFPTGLQKNLPPIRR